MHVIEAIGVIHSPYDKLEDMPIQPEGAQEVDGHIIFDEKYTDGLQDLDGFSHVSSYTVFIKLLEPSCL